MTETQHDETDDPRPHPFAGTTYEELIAMSNADLDRVMREGATPSEENLVGWEFRGFNPPTFAKVLGFQKFIKGFFRDDGGLAGYNLFVEDARAGADAPWVPKGGGGPSKRHGFYDVRPVKPGSRYDELPNAVLLDYGSGRNAKLDPEGRIRDYLVQVDPQNPDLYLGKAYLDLGLTSVFSNYFVIERLREAPTTG